MIGQTLYDKLWEAHVVDCDSDGTTLLYIDRQLIHEVTSPQAFEGLLLSDRKPWRAAAHLAVPDHNVPTVNRDNIRDPVSKQQLAALDSNCEKFEIPEFPMDDIRQGIVHVVGPEQGFTLPGITMVCGDSHTSTHGAFGALAFGIGTSDVEHVLATQCVVMRKADNMLIRVDGQIGPGVSAKDIALAIIGHIGTAGANGCAIEFAGEAISNLSMEGRMTVCNMAIEAGAGCGLIAVDQKTLDFVKGRPMAPKGPLWDKAVQAWGELHSDSSAEFQRVVTLQAEDIEPQVTWGTSPEQVLAIGDVIPGPGDESDPVRRVGVEKALAYMGLESGTAITDITIDKVFIGSCTNSRIEDLRAAAQLVAGRKVADNVKLALVVPGSGLVKQQGEAEGLHKIFIEAGFEWREPGCSMCLGMNDDYLLPGERCASTSNRNFEGRQGANGRTHLVSPAMAAAAAIAGHFVDVRNF